MYDGRLFPSASPAGSIGTTAEKLGAAAAVENHEHTQMYREFADKADEEGFGEIASAMRSIAIAEKQHEKRHLALLKNIESRKVFKRDGEEMAIPSIAPEECMYIGSLRCGPHPYEGGYDRLIAEAKKARERSYAP